MMRCWWQRRGKNAEDDRQIKYNMQGVWNGGQRNIDKSDDYEWNGKTEGDAAVYNIEQRAFGAGVSF